MSIETTRTTEREKNILAILDAIVGSDEISVSEIMQSTGVSSATVSRVVNYLKQLDIVVHKSKEITECGRRPEIYTVNASYGYVVLFDLCTDKIKGYLADINGDIKSRAEIMVRETRSVPALMNDLKRAFRRLIRLAGVAESSILVAGVSIPGITNQNSEYIKRIPDICRFEDVNVHKCISETLNVPVIVDNVSNLAAIGEKNLCYPECQNMVFLGLTHHFGVGGGIFIGGKLHYGSRGAAGEIGDMFFSQRNFQERSDDQLGPLERHAGLRILMDKVNGAMSRGRGNILAQLLRERNLAVPDLEAIEDAVCAMDYDVTDILDSVVKIWATAIIDIFALLDPEMVVVGGAITDRNTLVLDKIRHFVSKGLYFEPDIRFSTLGDQAQVFGGLQELRRYVCHNVFAAKAVQYKPASLQSV